MNRRMGTKKEVMSSQKGPNCTTGRPMFQGERASLHACQEPPGSGDSSLEMLVYNEKHTNIAIDP
jgi:hypothetical protein